MTSPTSLTSISGATSKSQSTDITRGSRAWCSADDFEEMENSSDFFRKKEIYSVGIACPGIF
jgi:hypothetical protein